MNNKNKRIYLDDVRTPKDPNWVVVRNYDEFVSVIENEGLENIDLISLDHDLGDSAMDEYYRNVQPNFLLDYSNITEKTGYDCIKYIVNKLLDNPMETPPNIVVHSANPIGSSNIMGYYNNYLMNIRKPQTCIRVQIPHTITEM